MPTIQVILPTGTCVVDTTSAEFQKSHDLGSVQLGTVTMRAQIMQHNKWVNIDPLVGDVAISRGASEASAFFARRRRDPERAKRLTAARARLGQALSATYGERVGLAALRLQQGLSQTELAQRMGTQQPAIARWERSPAGMSVETMIALATAMGVTPERVLSAIAQQREIEFLTEGHHETA